MKLKELFDKEKFEGSVTLDLVEEGVEYQCSDGFRWIGKRACEGEMPEAFLPYADFDVAEVYDKDEYYTKSVADEDGKFRFERVPTIGIRIYAVPEDDICEIQHTGGGCWCGVCKLEEGWFFGGTNSSGGFWKTYSQAWEAFPDEDCGFIRDVNDIDELRPIWTHIYETIIRENKDELQVDYAKRSLDDLEADLAEDPDVIS